MQIMPRTLLVSLMLALGLQVPAQAAPVDTAAAGCAGRVAVLGANMSAGGRFEVQRALAVGPHTVQLDETVADERAEAHGLVPPELLGAGAYSSAVLRPLPAGSGLSVQLNPAITLDTAQTYANALLTAGVTDAAVGVAAPTAQRAWGTTALLGLLRAARIACVAIDPARHDLAIREVALTSQLARLIGRAAAPSLLLALKSDAAGRRVSAPVALSTLVTRDATAAGVVVPAAYRPSLVAFLHDLVTSGAYSRVAAAHPSIATAGLLQSTVRLGGATAKSAPPRSAPPPAPVSHAGMWRGVVAAAGSHELTARLAGGLRTYALVMGAQVYRNGQLSSPAALRAGDAITITTNSAGLALVARASSATGVVAPSASAPAPAPAPALNAGVIAALALLVLLALLLIPFLVGWLRRRASGGKVAAPSGGLFSFIPRIRRRDR